MLLNDFRPYVIKLNALSKRRYNRYSQGEKFNPFLQPLIPYIRKLSKLAEEAGMPLAELCVRYLCSMPEIDGVLTGDGSDMADSKRRSGERMTVDQFARKSEESADLSDFILEKPLHRLHKFEFEIVRKFAAAVLSCVRGRP